MYGGLFHGCLFLAATVQRWRPLKEEVVMLMPSDMQNEADRG